MRWSSFWHGVSLPPGQDFSERGAASLLAAIAEGFTLDLIPYRERSGGGKTGINLNEKPMKVRILKMRVDSQKPVLTIELSIVEPAPGFRGGRATLTFVSGEDCRELPPKMFKDGPVPADVLKQWGLEPDEDNEADDQRISDKAEAESAEADDGNT